MKYASRIVKFSAALFVFAHFYGCGSQAVVNGSGVKEVSYELLASLEYIPAVKGGEGEADLLYEAKANPYVTRSKIKKASVAEFIEARKLFKAQQYEEAETQLLALTETDKSLSGPWVMLGDIAREKGDLTKAAEHYQKGVQVNRNNINAWLRLAYTQRQQGQYLKAQNTYVSALGVWRDCPEAHLNLAILYDLYLNLPIRAQKHMEAYVFLKDEKNPRVSEWLNELQGRTGVALSLPLGEGKVAESLVVAQ